MISDAMINQLIPYLKFMPMVRKVVEVDGKYRYTGLDRMSVSDSGKTTYVD